MSRHWSQSTCRHAPQGDAGGSASVTTATARNFRAPSEIALNTAVRSPHTVRPYDADSTLQPAEDRAVLREQRGADQETRVRGRGVLARLPRRVDEALLLVRREGPAVGAHFLFAFFAPASGRGAG